MNEQAHRGWLSVLALALLTLATVAPAKTLRVKPDGSGDFATIGAALEAARSGDTVLLEQGVYYGRGNQNLGLTAKAVTLTSRDPNDPGVVANTIIDCQKGNLATRYAIGVTGSDAQLILRGLTINNGYAILSGGAVWCEAADLEAVNCTFENNRIQSHGGAVYCHDSRARFVGCTFTGNTSDAMHGGAIHGTGSQIDITRCSFRANLGSAVETYDCQVTVRQCDFQDNDGRDGGAIFSRADVAPASTSLAVTRCTFTGNTASASGGALYIYGIRAAIAACTFKTNTAQQDGGAISNYRADPTIDSCLFVGNTAAGAGGAIQNLYNSSPEIVHGTFVANDAPNGGAVAALGGSNPLLSHSILWNNTATQGRGLYLGRYPWSSVPTATATIEYCDVEGDRDGTFVESGCNIRWGSGNLDADPLFIASSRGDYRLSADSPCIDAGDPKYLPETGKVDLDGRRRLLGAAVDVGAFECPGLGPVYRFWSPTKNKHFYTIIAGERDKLINRYANVWQYEGEAYYAFYQPVEENLLPVYRFWSAKLDAHFWTISEEERANLLKNYPGVWTPEGVAFYAYPPGRQPLGTLPVHRLWSNRLGYHFYTISEGEKNKLLKNYPQIWQYEGVAWYAYGTGGLPENTIYTFTGGPDEASYIMTLGAAIDGKEVALATSDVRLSTSSTWMQMDIDFKQSSAMLNRVHIQTAVTSYKTTLSTGPSGVAVPITLSVEGLLDVSTPEGPFSIDPSTGVFANLTKPNPNVVLKDPLAKCSGSIRLGTQEKTFTIEGVANRFETEAPGTFESLHLLPREVVANIPYTFQWHRQYTKDILADTTVDGHRVQVYVTSIYVGTQGRWQGRLGQ
jgi:predicted outer membrane repeat protein